MSRMIPTLPPLNLFNNAESSPEAVITFFCKNCKETDWRHVDGKCLFEPTSFAFSPRAEIVKSICDHHFKYHQDTPKLREQIAAYAKTLFEELARRGIPE